MHPDPPTYWMADGFHRYHAAQKAEKESLECVVRRGNLEDACWFSITANKTHGLRRSTADKQKAVKAALVHPKSKGLSDEEIANEVGVSRKTVLEYRKKLEKDGTCEKVTSRTGKDGRTIDTSGIGKTRKPKVKSEKPTPATTPMEEPKAVSSDVVAVESAPVTASEPEVPVAADQVEQEASVAHNDQVEPIPETSAVDVVPKATDSQDDHEEDELVKQMTDLWALVDRDCDTISPANIRATVLHLRRFLLLTPGSHDNETLAERDVLARMTRYCKNTGSTSTDATTLLEMIADRMDPPAKTTPKKRKQVDDEKVVKSESRMAV